MPTKNTTGNSSPFALCNVISVTVSSSSSKLSISLDNVIPSKNSLKVFSANCSSNSIVTVKNSFKFSILFSASIVLSSSSAFVYPDFFKVNLTNSEILSSSFLAFNSSMTFINSLEFKYTLFNPY